MRPNKLQGTTALASVLTGVTPPPTQPLLLAPGFPRCVSADTLGTRSKQAPCGARGAGAREVERAWPQPPATAAAAAAAIIAELQYDMPLMGVPSGAEPASMPAPSGVPASEPPRPVPLIGE